MIGSASSLSDLEREWEARAKESRQASALHSQRQRYLYWRNRPDKAAPYIGVRSAGRRWMAFISNQEQRVSCSLGSYDTQLEAAVAYDLMATALFGGTVMTNLDPSAYKPVPPQVMLLIAKAFRSTSRGDRKAGRLALRRVVNWQRRLAVRQGLAPEH